MEEVGKILPAVFKKQLNRGDLPLLELLVPLWPRVVGKAVARQCRPICFSMGTLTVATSCPTWATQLRHLGEEIRTKINRFLGTDLVKALRVRQDPTVRCPDLPADDAFPHPADHADGAWQDSAAEVEPNLADVLERSYSKYFGRHSRKVH